MVATMDLQLSQSEIALQKRARAFAQEVARPRAAAIDREEQYPWDIAKALADAGFCGMTIPKAFGGQGRPFLDAVLGWKLPQTRDGYTPKPSMRDAAE